MSLRGERRKRAAVEDGEQRASGGASAPPPPPSAASASSSEDEEARARRVERRARAVRQARRFVRAVGKQLLASDSLRLGLDRSTFRVQAVALLKSAESNGNNATTWLPEGGARFELSNKAAHYAKRLWHAYEKRTEAALRKREAEHGAASPARRSRTAASASAGATTGTALGDLDSLSALDEARCERVWRAAGEAHGKTREELLTALVRLPNRRVEWVAAYVDEAFPIVAHSDAIVPAQAAHLVFGVGAVEPLATLRDIVLARALRVIAAARGGLGHDSVCATLLPQLLAALASLADGIAQRAGRAVVKRLALVRVAALTACAAAGCAAGPSAVDRAAPVLQLLLEPTERAHALALAIDPARSKYGAFRSLWSSNALGRQHMGALVSHVVSVDAPRAGSSAAAYLRTAFLLRRAAGVVPDADHRRLVARFVGVEVPDSLLAWLQEHAVALKWATVSAGGKVLRSHVATVLVSSLADQLLGELMTAAKQAGVLAAAQPAAVAAASRGNQTEADSDDDDEDDDGADDEDDSDSEADSEREASGARAADGDAEDAEDGGDDALFTVDVQGTPGARRSASIADTVLAASQRKRADRGSDSSSDSGDLGSSGGSSSDGEGSDGASGAHSSSSDDSDDDSDDVAAAVPRKAATPASVPRPSVPSPSTSEDDNDNDGTGSRARAQTVASTPKTPSATSTAKRTPARSARARRAAADDDSDDGDSQDAPAPASVHTRRVAAAPRARALAATPAPVPARARAAELATTPTGASTSTAGERELRGGKTAPVARTRARAATRDVAPAAAAETTPVARRTRAHDARSARK